MPEFDFSFKTLWSPDDNVWSEILATINGAQKSILMMIYAFTKPELCDAIIAKHNAGLTVQCVLDLSQSTGTAERVQVQRLKDAGIDVVIGTSPVAHQIMHEKALIVDGTLTMTGSFNFSDSAETQVNHMDFVGSIDRAQVLSGFFQEIRTKMLAQARPGGPA
jgi:phosphatidylserine/phosphatidylglycerophosphate/cardiolipin synthase-like enzyme